MKNKPVQELKNSITKINCQLLRLKPMIETCSITNKAYNRLLIQRAFIRKKLKNMKTNNIFTFLIKKFAKKPKQKLICDYFK